MDAESLQSADMRIPTYHEGNVVVGAPPDLVEISNTASKRGVDHSDDREIPRGESQDAEDGAFTESPRISFKRPNNESGHMWPRKRHVKHHVPRFDYVELLNSEIGDVSPIQNSCLRAKERYSKHNITMWRTCFPNQLPLCQQQKSPGSCENFASKSDAEIFSVQKQLKAYAQVENFRMQPQYVSTTAKVLAACEISDECCKALEEEADVLASSQWCHERRKEEAKFGKYALLSTPVVRDLESSLTHRDSRSHAALSEVDDEVKESILLLNLGNWLELSERIFMNARKSEPLTSSSAPIDDMDFSAIFATAFIDFSHVALNITRRLVRTTILHAMSRLRATDIGDVSDRKLLVRRRDVLSALQVLRMKSDSREFWRGAARRLCLEVYPEKVPTLHKHDPGCYEFFEEPLSYGEVEKYLDDPFMRLPGNVTQESSGENHHSTKLTSVFSDLVDETADNAEHGPPLCSNEEDILSDDLEEHLEEHDCIVSSTEEHRLWDVLGSRSRASIGS